MWEPGFNPQARSVSLGSPIPWLGLGFPICTLTLKAIGRMK